MSYHVPAPPIANSNALYWPPMANWDTSAIEIYTAEAGYALLPTEWVWTPCYLMTQRLIIHAVFCDV